MAVSSRSIGLRRAQAPDARENILAGGIIAYQSDTVDVMRPQRYFFSMGNIVIRNVSDDLKARLRERAAAHGRSMEAEACAILEQELTDPAEPANLADLARSLFGPYGIDLDEIPDVPIRPPPDFSE